MSILIPDRLRCEYLFDPVGLDVTKPRLSWELISKEPTRSNIRQRSYQIVLKRDPSTIVWDSGKIESEETCQIECAGLLESRTHYTWKVRVWDENDEGSEWSASASFTMGLLQATDWLAKWIGAPVEEVWRETAPPALILRKAFTVAGIPKRAIVHVSALGLYEISLNGERVGDHILAPEWTDYHKRVQYQSYDVTSQIHSGENVLSGSLGPGWYAGRLGLSAFSNGGGRRGFYGRYPRLIVQLEIENANSETETVVTDCSWRVSTDGPIRATDLLDGELFDARCQIPGWDSPGFDDTKWKAAEESLGPRLVAQPNEPIRITQTLQPLSVSEPTKGTYIFDFGQNMVGWIRAKVNDAPGTEIRFRYAEVLNTDGGLYRDNLRGANQEDRYICDGAGVFEPHFTYHGFRYVEVTGLATCPSLNDLTGCVFHSSSPVTGAFNCSADLLNRIMTAIQWTQRGNMHSTPTDCPQRDERLGWMGDIQVFAQTAIYNMDMAAFFTKWLQDVRDAQADDGRFPDFAPHPYDSNSRFSGNPGWADAGVIVPWRAYVNYGDTRIVEESYASAKRWIEYVHRHNPNLIWLEKRGALFVYGDWLNVDTFTKLADFPKGQAQVPIEVYATAFFAYSTQIVAKMAAVLKDQEAATRYERLASAIRDAFVQEFVTEDGKIRGDTQGGYSLALHFDLLPSHLRPKAARHLLAALEPFHGHLSTGIQTTVRAMIELTRCGRSDLAFDLISKRTIPSWGYMIENGGTTMWERWDGWVEGGGFQDPVMNSFNHYAIGSVGEWMWKTIIGLSPDENAPGWKHFRVEPIPGGGLTWASGEYHSIRGLIKVTWRISKNEFELDVVVPPNTSATIQMPTNGSKPVRVESGVYNLKSEFHPK